MLRHLLDAQQRERQQILSEVTRIRGFMPLLMKPRNGGRWTATDRLELQEQIRALRHLSPYLLILALPGSVFLLPLLAWWLDRRRKPRRDNPDSPR